MTAVQIESLTKSFRSNREDTIAIDDLSLKVGDGEMLVLLGPSGCGKSTALNTISGLLEADAGRIAIGDEIVFDRENRVFVPPEKRNLGMVFQSYALWPHKTVRDNIGYPLKVRRMKNALREGWLEKAAELVRCEHLLDRYPSQLSGGQQQRIALARALVARPAVMLFDEPLSNVDALLREQVREDVHELHRRLGFTGVYVTHDQVEALAMADRLAVMDTGQIAHLGSPREVFERPATDYVADFVGFRNRLDLQRGGETGWWTDGSDVQGMVPHLARDDEFVRMRIRPGDLWVLPQGTRRDGEVCLDGALVVDYFYMGQSTEVVLESGARRLRAILSTAEVDPRVVQVGNTVTVAASSTACRLYGGEDGTEMLDASWTTSAGQESLAGRGLGR